MSQKELNKESLNLAANCIRFLSAEGVERAGSGHPGMPMGMAELGAVLWTRYLKFNPQDPKWLSRDRFVLSNGHGSMFLYSLLHLSGYDLSMEDIKNFRQWESKTPGHPENFMTPGVETTTGPLGQGVANAVGMAMGQKLIDARYKSDDFSPADHKVWCFCGDGCLMEGVSGEASSMAGHLGLSNLILVYDDNHITIAGDTALSFSEDVPKRYEAYGWRVLEVDGHDLEAIDKVYQEALAEQDKPVMIAARTTIGKGSPNKANTYGVHGSALGKEELELTKKNLGWPLDKEFYVPSEVSALFAERVEDLKQQYSDWQSKFKSWKGDNKQQAEELEGRLSFKFPADLEQKLIDALPADGKPIATRKLSGAVIQAASANVPALIGGSADLEPSTNTLIKDSDDVLKGAFTGKNIRFGVREHAMGAVMNGLSYYGGFIPYGSTFFCFLDYMRPAVRLAALSHLPGLFIFTHDSIFLGEDGPTHQAVEHLAILRMTPNLKTYRPADGLETALSYKAALTKTDGPSALVLTRQNLKPFERDAAFKNEDFYKGAYTVKDSEGAPKIVLVATGSEVPLAIEVAEALGDSGVRVVSMPCVEAFCEQDSSFRQQLIPTSAKKVVIEAATPYGWLGVVGGTEENTLLCTVDTFGASAPLETLCEKFGFTAAQIVEKIKKKLS